MEFKAKNNPLNLRFTKSNKWIGKIVEDKQNDELEEFESLHYAMRTYIIYAIKKIKAGKNTIESFVDDWVISQHPWELVEDEKYVSKYMTLVQDYFNVRGWQVNLRSGISWWDNYTVYRIISSLLWIESKFEIEEGDFIYAWISANTKNITHDKKTNKGNKK